MRENIGHKHRLSCVQMFHKQWQIVETCAFATAYRVHKRIGVCATHGTMLKNHLIFIALIFLLNHNRNATNQIVSNFARNYNTVAHNCAPLCALNGRASKREMMMTKNLAKNEIKSIVKWTRIYQLFVSPSPPLSVQRVYVLYIHVRVCLCR